MSMSLFIPHSMISLIYIAREFLKKSLKFIREAYICDYLSFFFIYSAIACLYYPTYGAIIFLLIVITACSNALQASSYQLFLDLYNFIKYQQAGVKIKFVLDSKSQKLSDRKKSQRLLFQAFLFLSKI